MLSPQPLNPADYAVVPTSPGQLLISPLKLPVPFNSPGFGRTPGAYVVQEGRLSLEMFDLGPHLASPNLQPALDLLAQTDEGTAVKALSALQRASSTVQLDLYAPQGPAPQKISNPALAGATSEQMEAKAAYTNKMLEVLPDQLAVQIQQTVADAKGAVGLQNFDSSRIEANLRAAIHTDTAQPSLPNPSYGMQAGYESYAHGQAAPQQARDAENTQQPSSEVQNRRPVRRKRARFAEDFVTDFEAEASENEEEDEMPPKKRVARMSALYDELRQVHQRNSALDRAVQQTEDELTRALRDNEVLWAMAAHIGAAMHAAFEELSGSGAGSGEQLAQPSEEQPDAQEAMVVNPPQPMPESGPAGVPMPTPGMNLASIFSPSGDDLFAACGMFVSPEDRLPAAGEATNADRPRQLFTEDEEHETRDGDVQLTKRDSFTFHP